ncbi:MAG: hypothetical protein QXL96_10525 [Ignisphaera sp.]
MGVEYIILAAVACIAFSLTVFGFLSLFLYIVEQTSRIPIISMDLSVYKERNIVLIAVIVKHKGGEVTTLRYLIITTDKGIIEIDLEDKLNNLEDIVIEFTGFKDGKTLLPGSTARIILRIPINYFYSSGEYHCTIVFDKTSVTSSFNL